MSTNYHCHTMSIRIYLISDIDILKYFLINYYENQKYNKRIYVAFFNLKWLCTT